MNIIVIGGGPAGILAACEAKKQSYLNNKYDTNVTIIEKNDFLGKKLLITGKGRCNITNHTDAKGLLDNTKTNKKFLYSAYYSFSPLDIVKILNDNNVKTKVERGNRVFPVSNKSKDVVNALVLYARNLGVKTVFEKIKNIEKNNEKWLLKGEKNEYCADAVIIATGGVSYPKTGSTGDGYIWAKKLGHIVTTLQPSLIPIEIKESFVKDMMGLSLKNIELSIINNKNKPIFKELGEMIFTHFGISGPVVLSASSYMDIKKIDSYKIKIDWKPGLTLEKLDKRLQREFIKFSNKNFTNSLDDLLPKKAIDIFINLSGISGDKKCHQITKDERNTLLILLKEMTITPKNFRPIEEAIITSGGIKTDEINSSTMESKIHDHLYFAGEIIDVDAFTGGYNLQIAYSTGYLAGFNAFYNLMERCVINHV